MDVNRIIERAKAIILSPSATWPVIKTEASTIADIYKNYLIYLAAIPVVATFIGTSIVGYSMPLTNAYIRVPFGTGFVGMIVSYILMLLSLLVAAYVISYLAPRFAGKKDEVAAFKLVAYSITPGWVAGILYIIPSLGTLSIIASLYGLYLFYQGLPILMENPREKSLSYAVVSFLVFLIIAFILAAISTSFLGVSSGFRF